MRCLYTLIVYSFLILYGILIAKERRGEIVKKIKIILALNILLFLVSIEVFNFGYAETIVLKSGKTINGKILERTDKKITIDFQGVPTTYFIEEIDTIRTEAPTPTFKTLKITYKTMQKLLDDKGNTMGEISGEKVKYIDAVNNKIRIETNTTTTMGDFSKGSEELEINDGKRSYNIDLKKKRGAYVDMPDKNKFPIYIDSWPSESDAKSLIGTEDILGKKCSIYSFIKGSKTWLWDGITLKEENKYDGTYDLTEATSIEENIAIDAAKFSAPKDVSIKSFDESMSDSLKSMKSAVKELNSAIDTKKTVSKTGSASIIDFGKAMYDPAAEQQFIDSIKNDKTIPEEKKPEMIKNFQEMAEVSRKQMEPARTKDGKIDVDKAIDISLDGRKKYVVEACQANLIQINGAKQVWAIDNNKLENATLTWKDLVPKYIHSKPTCAGGGIYTLGKVNENPTCSVKEHNPDPSVSK